MIYNDDIMKAVRQSFGLHYEDCSYDDDIMNMNKMEIFKTYCQWNGLNGNWYEQLLKVIENIYNIKLE